MRVSAACATPEVFGSSSRSHTVRALAIVVGSFLLCGVAQRATAMGAHPSAVDAVHAMAPPGVADRRDSALTELTLTPEHGALAAQLRTVARAAKRSGRIAVVDVGAPWCAGCHLLDNCMHLTCVRRCTVLSSCT